MSSRPQPAWASPIGGSFLRQHAASSRLVLSRSHGTHSYFDACPTGQVRARHACRVSCLPSYCTVLPDPPFPHPRCSPADCETLSARQANPSLVHTRSAILPTAACRPPDCPLPLAWRLERIWICKGGGVPPSTQRTFAIPVMDVLRSGTHSSAPSSRTRDLGPTRRALAPSFSPVPFPTTLRPAPIASLSPAV